MRVEHNGALSRLQPTTGLASNGNRPGQRSPVIPRPPKEIETLLLPQGESLRFTETSYYMVETWESRSVTDEQARLVRDYLATVERMLLPADRGALLTRILALLSHYRSDANPPEVEFVIAEDWAEDLGEFPAWAIDEAARQWRRTRKFRPHICEIRDSCKQIAASEMRLLDRLRRLASLSGNRITTPQMEVKSIALNLARSMRSHSGYQK